MRAVKANKEYQIDDSQAKTYQNAGFDIVDNDGKVIAYGKGKTVSYGEYAYLEEKVKTLEKENASLKKSANKAGKAGKADKGDAETQDGNDPKDGEDDAREKEGE